eukprot:CAMPEP_0194301940 /NCGR_PEP_ID=MMETSP0169-20130528/62065_1 /TAXON_ID=218684 /ORGANISM="Corethron pennatum, Strain L29A3" /LENGTH=79 /DNA_ID=CAMNT_0039052223 /DNA_START=1556 /DNA_END=1795 /DNA_ORIENTATION=-
MLRSIIQSAEGAQTSATSLGPAHGGTKRGPYLMKSVQRHQSLGPRTPGEPHDVISMEADARFLEVRPVPIELPAIDTNF